MMRISRAISFYARSRLVGAILAQGLCFLLKLEMRGSFMKGVFLVFFDITVKCIA